METFSNFSVFYSGVHNYEDRARAEAPDDSDINGDDDGDGDGNGDRLGTVVLAWSVQVYWRRTVIVQLSQSLQDSRVQK